MGIKNQQIRKERRLYRHLRSYLIKDGRLAKQALSDHTEIDAEWKDSRFRATVEHITVHNDGRLVFTFTNGSEETVMM